MRTAITRLSPAWLMVLATFLFATMGVCVKAASATYSAGEIVFYRGLVGMAVMGLMARSTGTGLGTRHPVAHLWRSLSGATSLCLWFYALGQLPLAPAVTLNYTASVWMALFLVGGAAWLGKARVDARLVATVAMGFGGVGLVLQPSLNQDQLWAGLVGLLSGMLSAVAYLQVASLGRLGEPEARVVFYFSIGSLLAGAMGAAFTGWSRHTWTGAASLLGVGVLATLAQWALTRAYAQGRSLVNASLQYLGIVFSFAYGVLVFQDPVTPLALLGMLLVVGAGLLAVRMRPGAPVAPGGCRAL